MVLAISHLAAQPKQVKFKRLGLKDGLSHPEIWSILKDSRGFVWFGTAMGLDRFDGYSIKTFFNDPNDSTSLPANGINRIAETPDGLLLIVTGAGMALYNPETERFERNLQPFFDKYGASKKLTNIVHDADGSYWFIESTRLIRFDPKENNSIIIQSGHDSTSLVAGEITDFSIDKNGGHWLVHLGGIAEKIEIQQGKGKVVRRIAALYNLHKSKDTPYRILADASGDVWFCAPSIGEGVFWYKTTENKLEHISANTSPLRLNTNAISDLVEDAQGLIWMGTDHGGINILDKKQGSVRYILHRDGDQTSLSTNSIPHLYTDDQGIIWAGAYKGGISYYHPDIYIFDVYKHYSIDPESLPFEDVNRFEEDAKGNLWIGTNGGGLLYFNREKGTFKQYLNEPGNRNSLSGNVIVSLCTDSENNLWIGTFREGLNKFDGKKFTRFTSNPSDTLSLPSQNVWEIFEDSQKRLWIGTLEAGAAVFDKKNGTFHRMRLWGENALQSSTIGAIDEDTKGNIWFGTIAGIDVLSEDGKTFSHYGYGTAPNALSSNVVFDITKDTKGRLWIGTTSGLNLYDESINGFKKFEESRMRKSVLAVEEDSFGNIWMSTLNGLFKMTFDKGSDGVTFKHYTESDGLQGLQFNDAGFKTKKGELVFGGTTGFNIFNGTERRQDFSIRKVVFSELELYEKAVDIGEEIDGIVVLKKSISEADEIVLPPNKNFFSLKFSAQNYLHPERDEYFYRIDGLNSEWLPVGEKNHEIVFNSLNPGNYKLRVKAANGDGTLSDNDAVLSIIILPPFWKTNTAFVLYAFALIVILLIARKVIQQREKLKYALVHEREEMQRVHELDMLKVKFFTNVSHEFRTPLSLILAPMEKLMRKASDPEQKSQFQLIQRNGRRLMNLVNQLLDFKKLEVHDIKFSPSPGDVIGFIRETVLSFSDLAEKKNIALQFVTPVEKLDALFDQDKLEKILFNLLGNAFKFTLENGTVSVTIKLLTEGVSRIIQTDISDTGIGIPEDKREKIFEPFFQTDLPKSIINTGSGIGLAITKEFVRIQGGRITVTSQEGKGSCFSVSIPVPFPPPESQAENKSDQISPQEMQPALEVSSAAAEPDTQDAAQKKKSLLLVEDNDDFRFYLKDNLKFEYTIYEARNGQEGWSLVLSLQPDLVVTDMMMPEMNGVELCAKIKSDERVSHIPVVLLTARSSEEQRIEGFNAGAEDYITKPFNFEVLEARINNLLRLRAKFQTQFRKTLEVKASELQITPLDVKFVDRAVKVVEANVSSPDFSVEDLAVELGISRAYVFKKTLALTGKTPLEFIRTIRLQHASQLLEKSQLSVQEVAYKVGFNNPKYFTKYFKEQYGVLPSEYAAGKRTT